MQWVERFSDMGNIWKICEKWGRLFATHYFTTSSKKAVEKCQLLRWQNMSAKWYSWQGYQSCAVIHRGLGGYKWQNRFIESFRSFFSSLPDREKGRVVGTSVWSCCQANSGTYAIFTWRNLSMQLIQIFSNVKIWFQVAHSNIANVCIIGDVIFL